MKQEGGVIGTMRKWNKLQQKKTKMHEDRKKRMLKRLEGVNAKETLAMMLVWKSLDGNVYYEMEGNDKEIGSIMVNTYDIVSDQIAKGNIQLPSQEGGQK